MNPFRYTEPVPPSELIDRDSEAETLLRTAVAGNNSRLIAPRRYGKTSLLRRVIDDAGREGWAAVYVDFFGVLTLGDVAARIERAYAAQLEGGLASWFAGIRRRLRPTLRLGAEDQIPAELELSLDPQAEPPLLERLALPRRIQERSGQRTLVVFAGSQLGMMRRLFADKRRALYGQARAVELSPLAPDDVAEDVAGRFARTNRDVGTALDLLLDAGGGHPQRTMLLANALWDELGAGETATEQQCFAPYESAMVEVRDELRAIWIGLGTGQRRVLSAVAQNRDGLYAAGRRQGGSRGGAVKSAIRALADRGEVMEDRRYPTGYRVVDPLLRQWIAAGTPGA